MGYQTFESESINGLVLLFCTEDRNRIPVKSTYHHSEELLVLVELTHTQSNFVPIFIIREVIPKTLLYMGLNQSYQAVCYKIITKIEGRL